MSLENIDAGAITTAHEFLQGKKVVMEVGTGRYGGTYTVDTEYAHDPNVVYIAIDKDRRALTNILVPEGLPAHVAAAVKDISSRNFLETDFFDSSVDLLYAFNVLDVLSRPGNYQEILQAIVSKFGRMLKPGGTIVLAHWYSPAFAHEVSELDYKKLGFTSEVFRGDDCGPALRRLKFTEHLIQQCVDGGDPTVRGSVPFVVVLKKTSGSI